MRKIISEAGEEAQPKTRANWGRMFVSSLTLFAFVMASAESGAAPAAKAKSKVKVEDEEVTIIEDAPALSATASQGSEDVITIDESTPGSAIEEDEPISIDEEESAQPAKKAEPAKKAKSKKAKPAKKAKSKKKAKSAPVPQQPAPKKKKTIIERIFGAKPSSTVTAATE